jgi:hypothetical protein
VAGDPGGLAALRLRQELSASGNAATATQVVGHSGDLTIYPQAVASPVMLAFISVTWEADAKASLVDVRYYTSTTTYCSSTVTGTVSAT